MLASTAVCSAVLLSAPAATPLETIREATIRSLTETHL